MSVGPSNLTHETPHFYVEWFKGKRAFLVVRRDDQMVMATFTGPTTARERAIKRADQLEASGIGIALKMDK